MRLASRYPPTRLGLMLMTEAAPSVMASAASLGRLDRLVEADRSRKGLGELGVLHQIVLGQRLFDEEQCEFVQATEQLRVDEGVRGVRVDLQRNVVAELLAHRSHGSDVPARLDLQLDSHVTLRQIVADGLEQLRDAVLDADGHSRGNSRASGTEVPSERLSASAQFSIENCHFDS